MQGYLLLLKIFVLYGYTVGAGEIKIFSHEIKIFSKPAPTSNG